MSRFLSEPANPKALDPAAISADPGPVGVLLINLGTPDAPTPQAVRRYLAEFLSDPRVIELPALWWKPILHLFVLTRRPARVAPKYRQIWDERGSPLLFHSEDFQAAVASALQAQGLPVHVALAMRYGNPSIPNGLEALRAAGCRRVLVVPLYPQYSATTTATAVDAVTAHLARLRRQPAIRVVEPFPQAPAYLDALERSVRAHWAQAGTPDRLLLSFHGLPERFVTLGDAYYQDCQLTAQGLRARLGADGDRVHVAFQSRFGSAPWLQPYTQPTLEAWGREGVRRVDVMCPGFLADCLETLEEIDMECREAFLESGGQEFHYIPCLNADARWARAFAHQLMDHLHGWS